MDGYELDPAPFYNNHQTSVSLYKGRSRVRQGLPVVLKRHDFKLIELKSQQKEMVQTLNAALVQAKVQHPNSCDVLEIQMEIEASNCSIYHVLEALDTDLEKDIEVRREQNRPYQEAELREVLEQTASVLTFAHSKSIAHRDVKPSNIFKRSDEYKLGDFGCFFMKRDTSITHSTAGDVRYMSPQLREACARRTNYNAFKTDVFVLGASLLHMATLTSSETLQNSERLDEAVGREVQSLPYSKQLKHLLRLMLTEREETRPYMQDLSFLSLPPQIHLQQIKSPKDTVQPHSEETKSIKGYRAVGGKELVHVTNNFLRFFNFPTSTWGAQAPLKARIQADFYSSWLILEDGRVFICGGNLGNEWNTAYILASDGAVQEKASMKEGRCGLVVLE